MPVAAQPLVATHVPVISSVASTIHQAVNPVVPAPVVAHPVIPAPASLFPIHGHPPVTTNTNIDQLLNTVDTTNTAPLCSPGLSVDISSIVAQEVRRLMNQQHQLPTQQSSGQGNSFISSSTANIFLSSATNCPLLPSDLPVSGGHSSLPAIPKAAMNKIKTGEYVNFDTPA